MAILTMLTNRWKNKIPTKQYPSPLRMSTLEIYGEKNIVK